MKLNIIIHAENTVVRVPDGSKLWQLLKIIIAMVDKRYPPVCYWHEDEVRNARRMYTQNELAMDVLSLIRGKPLLQAGNRTYLQSSKYDLSPQVIDAWLKKRGPDVHIPELKKMPSPHVGLLKTSPSPQLKRRSKTAVPSLVYRKKTKLTCALEASPCNLPLLRKLLAQLKGTQLLNLPNIIFTQESLLALSDFLKTNTTLIKLNLAYTQLGSDGLQVVLAALKNHKALLALDLSFNYLSPTKALFLANFLESNTKLTSLNLAFNTLGDEGMKALFYALRYRNKTLTALDVTFNQLSSSGLMVLAKMLMTNYTLSSLIVNEPCLDEAGKKFAFSVIPNFLLKTKTIRWYFKIALFSDIISSTNLAKPIVELIKSYLTPTLHDISTGFKTMSEVKTYIAPKKSGRFFTETMGVFVPKKECRLNKKINNPLTLF